MNRGLNHIESFFYSVTDLYEGESLSSEQGLSRGHAGSVLKYKEVQRRRMKFVIQDFLCQMRK
jgi:hypothetical protein